MFIVALTGGIATGKTSVTKVFKEHGIPVVDADQIAREGEQFLSSYTYCQLKLYAIVTTAQNIVEFLLVLPEMYSGQSAGVYYIPCVRLVPHLV